MPDTLPELRQCEFDTRQIVRSLRRTVFEHNDLNAIPELTDAERRLQEISSRRAAAEMQAGVKHGYVVEVQERSNLLGADTTGIEAVVQLRMASIPTALVHLFDSTANPLLTYNIRNASAKTKRLRLISYVDGYSARAVDTCELEGNRNASISLSQLPTFFPSSLASVTELTRATVNVEVQDLDARTEIHKTVPVWLLARTSAPLQVQDPSTGTFIDMTRYLGAFVTPNAPAVMSFVRVAAEAHPQKRLVGYQGNDDEVTSEVRAIYDALAASGIKYVNSILDFSPDAASSMQRVRLPRESLENRSANCIDGTVLMASLLEAVSLNPAIVLVPGHAFLAWETWRGSGTWRYVETTMISTAPFAEACAYADRVITTLQASADGPNTCKQLPLRTLRAQGITALE